ncbi:MAG: trypsin-like peptidase domain-containing protein [Clostridia bacterium]|nr:trypsin-like peptidase domain-containing protein [Clostridia bacterium]
MSDNWEFENKQEPREVSAAPADPAPAEKEEIAAPAPAEPAQQPQAQQPVEPAQQPAVPPVNGWGPDGSYRYVPPRSGQPGAVPPSQPTPTYGAPQSAPRYQSPAGGYGWSQPQPPVAPPSYTPAQAPVPPTPYMPPQRPEPPRKRRGWVAVIAVLGALAVVASVVVIAFAAAGFQPDMPPVGGDSSLVDDPSVNENAPTLEIDTWDTNDGGLSTEEIVNRNYDSTVVLTAYSQTGSFYFGESNLTEAGGSTGIIMSEDGYIITNRHCVVNENTGKNYDRIDVTTYDGTVYENATIIGTDQATDLAVIRVNATGLTPAQFGDSDELAVGARVVALGNAAGLSWTATQGIVSAKARDVYDDTGYAIKCLQVDLAINYGNSGGPLLNKQGLVVGINSAKIAASGYEGLGFSIPINEAKVIIDSLLKYGYVKGRVALGITGQTISSGQYKGFMIATIEKGSCLEGTGVQVNDLIVEVDGVTVVDYGTLRAELAKHQVGDTVTLKLLRSDRRTGLVTSHTVRATLGEQKG